MITIKLPYTSTPKFQEKLHELRKKYSMVVRYSFNRYQEKLKQTEIRKLCKTLNNNDLPSFIETCAILEAGYLYSRNIDKKVIFGGKFNFVQRLKNKISKEQFQEKRLLPLTIQGEKIDHGNRHFRLNIIDENFITFKYKKDQHFILHLPKLSKNYKKKLYRLEELTSNKKADIVYSVKLTENEIIFSFNEPEKEMLPKLNSNRYIGIDLNPENIGVSVLENDKILETIHFDLSKITNKIFNSGLSSDDPKSKHLNNKLKFETLQISKKIVELVKHYNCKFVFVEDLKFKGTKQIRGVDKKSKTFNRLTKNLWKRNLFLNNLEKRIELSGGKLFKVNPAYSSVIGNLQHDFSDPVNASLEIARRGFNVIIKKNKQFYPTFKLKSSATDLWKESATETFDNWKRLFVFIKNSKVKYRVSLQDASPKGVFSLNNKKSCILLYNFT